MKIRIILLVCCLAGSVAFGYEMRTWTSKSGTTAEAQLLAEDDYYVSLENAEGKKFKIRKALLSAVDVEYLKKQDERKSAGKDLQKKAFTLRGKVQQIMADGILLTEPYQVTSKEVVGTSDRVGRIKPKMRTVTHRYRVAPEYESVVVMGAKGTFDGAKWSGRVYPCGTYSYVTVLGSTKTVRRFTVSYAEAWKYHIGG